MQLSRNASLRAFLIASWKDSLHISAHAIHPASLCQSEIQKNQHICPHLFSGSSSMEPYSSCTTPSWKCSQWTSNVLFSSCLAKGARGRKMQVGWSSWAFIRSWIVHLEGKVPWDRLTALAMTKVWKKSLFLWRSQFVLQPVRGRETLRALCILWSWVRCTRTVLPFSRPFYNL